MRSLTDSSQEKLFEFLLQTWDYSNHCWYLNSSMGDRLTVAHGCWESSDLLCSSRLRYRTRPYMQPKLIYTSDRSVHSYLRSLSREERLRSMVRQQQSADQRELVPLAKLSS